MRLLDDGSDAALVEVDLPDWDVMPFGLVPEVLVVITDEVEVALYLQGARGRDEHGLGLPGALLEVSTAGLPVRCVVGIGRPPSARLRDAPPGRLGAAGDDIVEENDVGGLDRPVGFSQPTKVEETDAQAG